MKALITTYEPMVTRWKKEIAIVPLFPDRQEKGEP